MASGWSMQGVIFLMVMAVVISTYLFSLLQVGASGRTLAKPSILNAWESTPCLSPDKQELYFSSNRPGGYGGSDIYVSRLRPNGRWSSPQNLGPLVNTAGDESAPFMHADNETLYFTSSGLQGYGGKDIFFSKKKLSGFDKAVNLGYPINTIDNEGGLIVAANGVNAFYSSDRADSPGWSGHLYF